MTDLRFIPIPIPGSDLRICALYRNRPHFEYAVMLQIPVGDRWQTIHLFDNAHGENEMHRYTGTEKQPAEPFAVDRFPQTAMPAAIEYLKKNWREVLATWKP